MDSCPSEGAVLPRPPCPRHAVRGGSRRGLPPRPSRALSLSLLSSLPAPPLELLQRRATRPGWALQSTEGGTRAPNLA